LKIEIGNCLTCHHWLWRKAGFDGGFNGNKFFVLKNSRHGGETSRQRTAIKSQFF
jgi:hypothetical protein